MGVIKSTFIIIVFLLLTNHMWAIIPERNGWWKFDNSANLVLSEPRYNATLTLSGSHTPVSGPQTGNGAVLIGPGSYYKMKHLISANGNSSMVNEYTLQYDFKIPDYNNWHCFFQTNVNNTDDGDLFINKSGNIGVAAVGYSGYTIIPNEWYRLVVSVKNGSFFNIYLDGKLLLSGNIQNIDQRFALENTLLLFADNDSEDDYIYCSELAVWGQALTAEQVNELGGFGHYTGPAMMTRIPFLQSPDTNSMTISWHDISSTGTKVEYGINANSLNNSTTGSNELVSEPYRWHTVKLSGLDANTRYFYRVLSGEGASAVYSFKTLPGSAYKGKIRFLLFSDTHASDTTMAGKIQRAARDKISELYGPDIENQVVGILHSGDIVVSGNSPEHYTKQFFMPLSAMSSNLPTMVVAGNHEGESPYFYSYMKLDALSAFPQNPALNEKIWNLKVGNSLFIGLNTNITSTYGSTQASWLDSRLKVAETDTTIDFVYLFFHHPPFSELWKAVNTFDAGSNYVRDVLIPVIKKYTKVQELHYGHTHGFERGTITSARTDGDFRIICGGGGGGPLDPWAIGENEDYNDIHITISNYCFQILEIDIADHSYRNTMYSLGTLNSPKNPQPLDSWYKKKAQTVPDTPVTEGISPATDFIQFNSSVYSGPDFIMSVRLQVIDSSNASHVVIDTLVHWKNIYGVGANNNPVDLNKGIDLYHLKLTASLFPGNNAYFFRVRYRDQNLKWSNWSVATSFKTTGIHDVRGSLYDKFLDQNYPNHFKDNTIISYKIPEKGNIIFRVYNSENRLVDEIDEGLKPAGTYQLNYNAGNKPADTYIYKLITGSFSTEKKMIKIK